MLRIGGAWITGGQLAKVEPVLDQNGFVEMVLLAGCFECFGRSLGAGASHNGFGWVTRDQPDGDKDHGGHQPQQNHCGTDPAGQPFDDVHTVSYWLSQTL